MNKVLMPIKVRHSDGSISTEQDYFYLASEADARIAELEKALREIVERVDTRAAWNMGTDIRAIVSRVLIRDADSARNETGDL